MGEFDDVLAMEPGDEWDDYDGGDHAPPAQDLPPSVATLRVAAATLELRGDVPPAVIDALEPLTVAPACTAPDPAVVSLVVEASGGGHQVVDHDRGELAHATTDAELTTLVASHLLDVAAQAAPRLLQLRVAAVELADGRGVLIVDPDESARHRLVGALVDGGARYLGADRVVLQPGSRTVLALPAPLRHGDVHLGAAQVAAATTVSLVVVVGMPGAGGPDRLGRPHGCARLLVDGLHGCPDGQELVRSVAQLSAAAAVWEVPAAVPEELAGTIASLDGPTTHELAVLRRLSADRPDLVSVRFRHGGVLADVGRAVAFEVAEEELPTLDALRWPVVARDPAGDAAVLAQLAAAGIDLADVVAAGVTRAPGPDSYGLPDSPIGAAGSALWDEAAIERALSSDPRLAPVLAHATRRGDLAPGEQVASRLATLADQVAARAALVTDTLASVVARLDEIGVEPLVLGPAALAHDGPLPAGLVPVERVDLMLAQDELAPCTQELLAAGARLPATDPEADPDQEQPAGPVRLVLDEVEVVLRDRLAGGPFGELVDHDELLDRSVAFRLRDRWLHALHPDDRFVWACVQRAEDGSTSPTDLREVVLDAPWSRDGMAAVLEASARWGATRTVLATVRSVELAVAGLSPWLVERATRPAPPPERRRRRGNRRI